MNVDTQAGVVCDHSIIGDFKLCNYGSRMFSLFHAPSGRSKTLTEVQWASVRGTPSTAKCESLWEDLEDA